MKSRWVIEIHTCDVLCQCVEVDAYNVIKKSPLSVLVDGKLWTLIPEVGTFGEIRGDCFGTNPQAD